MELKCTGVNCNSADHLKAQTEYKFSSLHGKEDSEVVKADYSGKYPKCNPRSFWKGILLG